MQEITSNAPQESYVGVYTFQAEVAGNQEVIVKHGIGEAPLAIVHTFRADEPAFKEFNFKAGTFAVEITNGAKAWVG